MFKELGPRPNLDHLRKQAKHLLAAYRRKDSEAAQRFREAIPWLKEQEPALHDAQSAIAREYGFASWPQLVRHVQVRQTIEAARAGDEAELKRLLNENRDLAAAADPKDRITPLREAAAAGNLDVVRMLLEHGADPNALDVGDNASPLHFAAEKGRLDVVKLLVEAGADVNWNKDVHALGPLGWATFFGAVHHDVAAYLIGKGARIDMFSAIALGRVDDVRRIAQEDPVALDRRSVMDQQKSPIEFAAEKKQLAIAQLLVELGASVGLVEAAALGDLRRLRHLMGVSPSPDRRNRVLMAAVKAGQTEAAQELLENGTDPNHAEDSTTLIFDAVLGSDRSMAELLLRHGADLEWQDPYWKSTPLGWAVFFGRTASVRLAIDLGARVDPQMIELARSGERGELRAWSEGSPESFAEVQVILAEALQST